MSTVHQLKFSVLGAVVVLVVLFALSLFNATPSRPALLLTTTSDLNESMLQTILAVEEERGDATASSAPIGQDAATGTYQQQLERDGAAAAVERLSALIGVEPVQWLVARRRAPKDLDVGGGDRTTSSSRASQQRRPAPEVISMLQRLVDVDAKRKPQGPPLGMASPLSAANLLLHEKLLEAYSPLLQVRQRASEEVPFVSLVNDSALGTNVLLWWDPAVEPDVGTKVRRTSASYSILSGLSDVFADGRPSEDGNKTMFTNRTLHASLRFLDAQAAAQPRLDRDVMMLFNQTASSWQVVARSVVPLAPYEHAGAEGVCVNDDSPQAKVVGAEQINNNKKALSAEQFLCLVFLDVLDVLDPPSSTNMNGGESMSGPATLPGGPTSRRAKPAVKFAMSVTDWFGGYNRSMPGGGEPCRGAALFYRQTKRMHRNFVPPVAQVRCDAPSGVAPEVGDIGWFSVFGETLKAVGTSTAKKLRNSNILKLLDKMWLDNTVELRNVCLGADGRLFGKFSAESLRASAMFLSRGLSSEVQSENDEIHIMPIKREQNRRCEKLRVSPLIFSSNGTRPRYRFCHSSVQGYMLPILDPALNLAHMFFRLGSNQLSAGYPDFVRTAPEQRLSVFHSAYGGDGMMPGNNFRLSYSQLRTMWLGIWPNKLPRPPYPEPQPNLSSMTEPAAKMNGDDNETPPLLCFTRLRVLWRTLLMYGSKNKLAAGAFNNLPWKFTLPALRSVRTDVLKCLVARELEPYRIGDPIVVTVVQRRPKHRAIVNLGRLLQAFALDLAVLRQDEQRRADYSKKNKRKTQGEGGGGDLPPIPAVQLRVIDMDVLSPHEQARLVHESDILVGPHGAGMAWGLLLRPKSVFVEFRDMLHNHPSMVRTAVDDPNFIGSEYGKVVYASGAHYLHVPIYHSTRCYGHLGLGIHHCDYLVSPKLFVRVMRSALDTFLQQAELFQAVDVLSQS